MLDIVKAESTDKCSLVVVIHYEDHEISKFSMQTGIILTHRIKLTCHLYRTVNSLKTKPPKNMTKFQFFFSFQPTNNFLGGFHNL